MTILDRARVRRIRIDPRQFADDLAKRLPDLEPPDLGKARDAAGDAIADASRGLRSEVEKAGDRLPDHPIDELGQRLRALAATGLGKIDRELPDTDKDRYDRAFERGRVRSRTKYLVAGTLAGVAAAALGIVFLDPERGKARRDDLGRQVRGKVKFAQDRARGIAIERGIIKPEGEPVGVMDPDIGAPGWPATEGPLDQPLDDPMFGAHEALPEDLVGAGRLGSDNESAPRA